MQPEDNQATIAAKLEQLWSEFRATFNTAVAAADRLRRAQMTELGLTENWRAPIDWNPAQTREDECHVARNIIGYLVDHAQKTLSQSGVPVKIKTDDVSARFMNHQAEFDPVAFSPKEVWAYLETTYGGGKADELGYRQAADQIVRSLGLRADSPIKRVAGCIELEDSIWTEACYGTNLRKLSWSGAEGVTKLITALDGFLAWAGELDTQAGADLRSARQFVSVCASRDGFSSRHITGGERIEFCFFYTKLRLRLVADLGDKLGEFLSTYSERLHEAA